MTDPLRTDLYFRAHVAPVRERKPRGRRVTGHPSSVAERVLVLVMEHEDEGSQPRALGMYRVLARSADGTYALAIPKGFDEPVQGSFGGDILSTRGGARGKAWAWDHEMPLLDAQEFAHAVFLREAYRYGAAVAGYELHAILASLATSWGTGRGRNQGSWILWLCPRPQGKTHRVTMHPDCPAIRVTPRRPPMNFFTFTHPHKDGRWHVRPHPGRWLSLREKIYSLTGGDENVAGALGMFGLDVPAAPASSSIEDRLQALLERLEAICRLTEAILQELRQHPALSDESEVRRRAHSIPRAGLLDPHSPASVLRAYMHAVGITGPPRLDVRADGLDASTVLGAAAFAFHAPRAEVLVRGVPVQGVMLDIRSCFPASALLQGLDPWWAANRLVAEDRSVEEARGEVEASSPQDYFVPTPWSSLTDLYLIQPCRDLLPATIRVRNGKKENFESVLAEVTVPEDLGPVWYTKADVLISRWRTGRTPHILRVLRFRPEGERPGLREERFRGAIPLDPRRLIASLVQARRTLDAQGLPHRAAGAKVMCNIASYGIAAQLLRHLNITVKTRMAGARTRGIKKRRLLMVRDGVRSYQARPDYYEEPQAHTCWPLAIFAVAGSRLLLELMETAAREAGGELAMVFTDSGAVVSQNGVPPDQIARAVVGRLEPLNPFGSSLYPFLKPQEGTPDAPRAAWAYGVASPSYTRYRRERTKHERITAILKPNGFVLSIFCDPTTRRPVRKGMVPEWWSEAWRFMLGCDRPGRKATEPAWLREPATQVLSYQSPVQESMVRHLRYPGGGRVRPFTTLYLRHYYTEPILYSWEWKDELSLSPDAFRPGREYEQFLRVLVGHIRRPERKMADGEKTGRLTRYVVEATAIYHLGRETPPTIGQENQAGNAMLPGEVQVYKPIPRRQEVTQACAVLRRFPRKAVARLLGTTPYSLRDTLLDRADPTPERRRRIVALVTHIQSNGGMLPATTVGGGNL